MEELNNLALLNKGILEYYRKNIPEIKLTREILINRIKTTNMIQQQITGSGGSLILTEDMIEPLVQMWKSSDPTDCDIAIEILNNRDKDNEESNHNYISFLFKITNSDIKTKFENL